MIKLGTKILNAVRRSKPLNLFGKPIHKGAREIFDMKNPYILEVLPDNPSVDLTIFQGKKLKTVCHILDQPDCASYISRYQRMFPKNAKFNELELKVLYQKAFRNGKVPTDCNIDAFVLLHDINPQIGKHFDAHGIAKVSITDQLKQLNELLSNGIDKTRRFDTAPLACDMPAVNGAVNGTAGGHAYWDGSFIVISGKGKSLVNDGIEYVIVNDAYYNIVEDLAKKFPTVKFIRADEAAKFFNKL